MYSISGYNNYFSPVKRNQNDGLILCVKTNLSFDLYDYDFEENNIIKLTIVIEDKPTCTDYPLIILMISK